MNAHDHPFIERLQAIAESLNTRAARPATDQPPGRRQANRSRWLLAGALAAAAVVLPIATVAVNGQVRAGPDKQEPVKRSAVVRAAPNGWVAVDIYRDRRLGPSGGSDIYLVRPGEHARRLEVSGSEAAADACPAWSPDGRRLMFGRLTGSSDSASRDAELVIVPVRPGGATGAPDVIALDGFKAPDGVDPYPCATWAPDGRWVALRGPGAVWVVDTQTGTVRSLPNLRPTDLEWRPGTDQLAIAGDIGSSAAGEWSSTPVTVYSVSTGELHHLGSVVTTAVAWSPNGSTLAFERPDDHQTGLGLVNADGTNERLLVADLHLGVHGIGPVWSPTGDRIAYQRQHKWSAEGTDVVLVSVADGTQTVIEPPKNGWPDEPQPLWYPYDITWSPDGTTLLYTAFSGHGNAVISLPADAPRHVTVLTDLPPVTSHKLEPWAPIQAWGRRPG